MPISLPPYSGPLESSVTPSRRRFLSNTLLAAAGALVGPTASGQTRKGPDSTPQSSEFWALFADTHIPADPNEMALGFNMAAAFQDAVREVLAVPTRPTALLINGDCAFRKGAPGDYAALTRMLDPLRRSGVPVHLTLGNHDDRQHFKAALPESGSEMGERHVGILATETANWLLADSSTTPIGEGRFGRQQLSWMRERLDAEPNKPAIIFAHHNPRDGRSKWPLEDTEEFFDLVAPRKQVKAYIFGHSHHWSVEQHSSGIHLVNLPSTAYVFRTGEPRGWVRSRVDASGMELELRCIDPADARQGERHRLAWR